MKTVEEQIEEIRQMYRAEGKEIEEIYRTMSTPTGENVDGKIADVELIFPTSGEASTYSDSFQGLPTASGAKYSHNNYTAAVLPKTNWHILPMKTRLRVTYMERSVVVEVNDRGKGKIIDGKPYAGRVLDLSRIAMAYLKGVPVASITDGNAGVIYLSDIQIVPSNTPLGPRD